MATARGLVGRGKVSEFGTGNMSSVSSPDGSRGIIPIPATWISAAQSAGSSGHVQESSQLADQLIFSLACRGSLHCIPGSSGPRHRVWSWPDRRAGQRHSAGGWGEAREQETSTVVHAAEVVRDLTGGPGVGALVSGSPNGASLPVHERLRLPRGEAMSVGHSADLIDLVTTGDRILSTRAPADGTHRASASRGTVAL